MTSDLIGFWADKSYIEMYILGMYIRGIVWRLTQSPKFKWETQWKRDWAAVM